MNEPASKVLPEMIPHQFGDRVPDARAARAPHDQVPTRRCSEKVLPVIVAVPTG